ncbi:hypothetical protein E2C01_067782 [Portunus trituberculatus]|uniref:Uncharacterized protein n=1 Tax=Portunus trituberculatus TaxID=210409 RepID=A0A5B7HTT9_PORTR|nr:hypothetical protein [Portunus trituberculatus]
MVKMLLIEGCYFSRRQKPCRVCLTVLFAFRHACIVENKLTTKCESRGVRPVIRKEITPVSRGPAGFTGCSTSQLAFT